MIKTAAFIFAFLLVISVSAFGESQSNLDSDKKLYYICLCTGKGHASVHFFDPIAFKPAVQHVGVGFYPKGYGGALVGSGPLPHGGEKYAVNTTVVPKKSSAGPINNPGLVVYDTLRLKEQKCYCKLVTKKEYDAVIDMINSYSTKGNYKLFGNNCMDLVKKVSDMIGADVISDSHGPIVGKVENPYKFWITLNIEKKIRDLTKLNNGPNFIDYGPQVQKRINKFYNSTINEKNQTGYKIDMFPENALLGFRISDGIITDLEGNYDDSSLTLLVDPLNGAEKLVTITLPRFLLDSQVGNSDIPYHVRYDDENIDFEEVSTNENFRTLKIPIPENNRITIAGTEMFSQEKYFDDVDYINEEFTKMLGTNSQVGNTIKLNEDKFDSTQKIMLKVSGSIQNFVHDTIPFIAIIGPEDYSYFHRIFPENNGMYEADVSVNSLFSGDYKTVLYYGGTEVASAFFNVKSSEAIAHTWIKDDASSWTGGQINDFEFVNSVKRMMDEDIIEIPDLRMTGRASEQNVPDWIKKPASWFSDELISEQEYLNLIKYLTEKGIILVN